ncbi:16S rRNA methyltransferase [Arcanobacterium haemolyticum]|nr:16S rRNA methyltransferase [Arcanobacterium haemolyticum]
MPTNTWHPRRQSSDPARLVAWDVLRAVDEDGAYANIVLPRAIREAGLRRLDAAFATNLCYGTLRMRGRWDAIIARCVQGRDISEIDPPVMDLLRMGCQQLLGLQTPPHAAINETVAIARNEFSQSIGGFVNAVLRRVTEKSDDWHELLKKSSASEREFEAMWYSHPRWVVDILEESLIASGRVPGDLGSVLAADNEPARVALVPRDITKRQLIDAIEQRRWDCEDGVLMPNAVLISAGDPGRLAPIRRGDAGVQDEGSQLIAAILAHAPLSGPDRLWLDMCAGPGGKTATLASYAANRGAEIHANEPHPHRLDLVAQAVEPWEDIVALREGDGRDLGKDEPESYDRILVDAPCSGLGALRRRPEARWRKSASDIDELVSLQGELLASAFAALRPGGMLVYSTCSPVPAETRGVVEAFLASEPRASIVDAAPVAVEVALREVPSHDGMIQLWPDTDETDAMFIALLTKDA